MPDFAVFYGFLQQNGPALAKKDGPIFFEKNRDTDARPYWKYGCAVLGEVG
jgi:hypothetical protein